VRGEKRGKGKNIMRVGTKTIEKPKGHKGDPATGRHNKTSNPLDEQSVNFETGGDYAEASISPMVDDDVPGDKVSLATPKEGKGKRFELVQSPARRGGQGCNVPNTREGQGVGN